VQVTLVEQMTTDGKHTPTSYMNGRCTANGGTIPCHFWLMFVDNKVLSIDTPADVVGVLVVDRFVRGLAHFALLITARGVQGGRVVGGTLGHSVTNLVDTSFRNGDHPEAQRSISRPTCAIS
jgi:hypothetical protein